MEVGRCFLRTNSKPTGMRSNRFQQHSLVDNGNYVPGIKQIGKAVAAFYFDALSAYVTAIPLTTNSLQ